MAKRWVPINLTGGINADSNLDNVEVADVKNLVSDPDGQGMKFREGTAIYQRANQTTTPEGGIAIVVNSRVPNFDNGSWLVTCSNTTYNNRIELMAMTKPRNGVSGETIEATVAFEESSYFVMFGQTVTLTVIRDGNLSREASVDYATANGTASAGTDYTAASGTVTFAAGEFEKTINITTLDGGQTLDKSFTVTLSNGSTGVSIEEPRVATITGQAMSLLLGHGDWNSTNTLWPVYLYNPVAGRVTAHYLQRPNGVAVAHRNGNGDPIVRINRNTIFTILGDSTDAHILKFAFYSLPQIYADGAAYSAGALNIGAAIKHTTFSHGLLIGASGTNEGENFWIVPYTDEEFFVVGLSRIWRFDAYSGAATAAYPIQTGSASFTTWTNIAGLATSGGCGCRPQFGPNGMLYVYVDTMNSTNVRKVLMFDPSDMSLQAISSALSGQGSAMAILPDGSVIMCVGGTGATGVKFSADLATTTALTGTFGVPRIGFYSGGSSWYGYNDDSPPLSFRKFSLTGGSTITTDVTYPAGPPFDINVSLAFQMGLLSATTFAAGYRDGAGNRWAGVYNVADGTVAAGFAQIDQQDFYGAEAIAGSLFSTSGFGTFAKNDQPDITLYHLKNFAGLMS